MLSGSRQHSRRGRKESRIARLKEHIEALPEPESIKIGIPGIDELLEEGIPKDTNILVAGGTGTGKTTS